MNWWEAGRVARRPSLKISVSRLICWSCELFSSYSLLVQYRQEVHTWIFHDLMWYKKGTGHPTERSSIHLGPTASVCPRVSATVGQINKCCTCWFKSCLVFCNPFTLMFVSKLYFESLTRWGVIISSNLRLKSEPRGGKVSEHWPKQRWPPSCRTEMKPKYLRYESRHLVLLTSVVIRRGGASAHTPTHPKQGSAVNHDGSTPFYVINH